MLIVSKTKNPANSNRPIATLSKGLFEYLLSSLICRCSASQHIMNRWVFGLRSCPHRKTLAREPNARKPLNPTCFILCVSQSFYLFLLFYLFYHSTKVLND